MIESMVFIDSSSKENKLLQPVVISLQKQQVSLRSTGFCSILMNIVLI